MADDRETNQAGKAVTRPPETRLGPASFGADPFEWLRSEMNRFWGELSPFGSGLSRVQRMAGLPVPAVEVEEAEDAYKVSLEVPGVDPNDVTIELLGDQLRIAGEKKSRRSTDDRGQHLTERSYGSFERRLRVPDDVDRDGITAAAEHGVVTITLPRAAHDVNGRRKIAIQPGGNS